MESFEKMESILICFEGFVMLGTPKASDKKLLKHELVLRLSMYQPFCDIYFQ